MTRLLRAWQTGDDGAFDRLVPLVYGELRQLAHARMRRENPGHTLQTTALVHEAYLRLAEARTVAWKDRKHFFALCARTMRRILVDGARTRGAAKRGSDAEHLPLCEGLVAALHPDLDLLALDEALTQFSAVDPRRARVVELRYFGGLSVEETAAALGVSPQTVLRDWSIAKLWLGRALRHAGDSDLERAS